MLSDQHKEEISQILKTLLEHMGIVARISPEDTLSGTEFNIYTPDSRLLIGQHGANLAALQQVLNTITIRRYPDLERFTIDIDDYRKQREYRLREIAKRAVREARSTAQPVAMEAMNAYDRRIIHAYVSTEEDIETESVGAEPNRKIIVKPKEKGTI